MGDSDINLGENVAPGGDLNGDGSPDVVAGMTGWPAGFGWGAAAVFYGPVTGTVFSSAADSIIESEEAGEGVGDNLVPVGELTGDGYDDLWLGGPGHTANSLLDAGAAYLIPGPPTGGTSSVAAATTRIEGGYEFEFLGAERSVVGDVDGDGWADFALGMAEHDYRSNRSGLVVLFYGPIDGMLDQDNADVQIIGAEADDFVGLEVAGVGDHTGDGRADFLVHSYSRDDSNFLLGVDDF